VSILTKHFPSDVPRGRGHNICITFGRPAPKIWEGKNNVQNSARFLTTFDFDREYLRNDSRYPKSERKVIDSDSFRVLRKSPVNFGPQTKKFYWLTLSHPSGLFGGDYISALRGCCLLKFLHALEIDQDYLANTPTGTGVPQKNFNRENVKFGLKFSVLATITSGLVGVSSQNIFHAGQ